MKLELADIKSEDSTTTDDIDDNSSSAPSTYERNRSQTAVSNFPLMLFCNVAVYPWGNKRQISSSATSIAHCVNTSDTLFVCEVISNVAASFWHKLPNWIEFAWFVAIYEWNGYTKYFNLLEQIEPNVLASAYIYYMAMCMVCVCVYAWVWVLAVCSGKVVWRGMLASKVVEHFISMRC